MKTLRIILFSAIFFGLSLSTYSQNAKIHALFVLKFVENINWPQDRRDVVIGVVGKGEIFAELDARLKAKTQTILP